MTILYRDRLETQPGSSETIEISIVRPITDPPRAAIQEVLGADYKQDAHGKPVLPDRSLAISHVRDMIVIATRGTGRIGVDAELVTPEIDMPPPHGLTYAELEILRTLSPADRVLGIFRFWTAKEALGKALGLGTAIDFSRIELAQEAGAVEAARLYGRPELAAGWRILHREYPIGDESLLIAVAWDSVNGPK
jgi:phosphopantetheinyl transferase